MRIANGDADALVQAVLHYERDADSRQRQGRRARELFEERFTRSRGISAFMRLIETQESR